MLITKLNSMKDKLTKSDKKIVDYIINNVDTIKDMNSYDISNEVKVSQATVIRFSQKIGYKSFSDLLLNINNTEKEKFLEKDIEINESTRDTNNKITNLYKDVISLNNEYNDWKEIEETVKLIVKKKRIIIFGVGNSALVAIDFANKLNKFRKEAFSSQDTHIMLSMISNLSKEDLLILISSSGETREVLEASKLAEKNGVKIVSITSFSKNKLHKISDILLKTSGYTKEIRLDATTSRISQLVLVDMIFINFLKSNYDTYKDYIKNSDEIINKIKF